MNVQATDVKPALFDVNASTAYLGGIGRTQFYALASQGDIRTVKIGRRTFVTRDELDRYIAALGLTHSQAVDAR
ncbi:helix-turn-helix domain-containing protein [Demequina lutea]|uniref:Excisionase family DNA binding protein n=1 Tax=Demequina lutea TaxID=431489 RepID=A0A7Z0CKA1_9MICO|nr:helix-turn-helix domain-containing protein [Demequina lutea]NYI41505.1 excisionase family DNA binding protein [Demequina lutea]